MIFDRLVEILTTPIAVPKPVEPPPPPSEPSAVSRSVMGPPCDVSRCEQCGESCLVGACPVCGEEVKRV